MKKLYFFLPLLMFTFSCNGQVKTDLPKDSAPQPTGQTNSDHRALINSGTDPYFVESEDTVSVHGPVCIVRDVLQDKNGNYWFATWHGIMGYDGKVFTNYTLKYDLIHFHVVSLYEDKKGNIWFGTARGGLYRYDGKSFTLFTTKEGLADNTVMCIEEDKEGNIWLVTENGASRYNGETFTNFTAKEALSSNYINSVIQDKTGKLWLGGDGIAWYDGQSFVKFTDKKGQPFQKVASLFEDKTGKIWIGSGKGLCYYDGKSVSDFLIPDFVMYMCEDKKGNLWLAHNEWPLSPNFKLYRYDGKSFTAIHEQTNPSNNTAIFGIMADNDGNIWFGTARGVCRYSEKGITYFTEDTPIEYLKQLEGEYIATGEAAGTDKWKIEFKIVNGELTGNDRGYQYKLVYMGDGKFVNSNDGATLIFDTRNKNAITLVLLRKFKFRKL